MMTFVQSKEEDKKTIGKIKICRYYNRYCAIRYDVMQLNAIRYEILICIAIPIAVSSFFKNNVWRAVCDVILYHTVCCVMVRCGVW